MNNTSYSIKLFAFIVLFALAAVAYSALGMKMSPYTADSREDTGVAQASSGEAVALPVNLLKVYRAPESGSEVAAVFSPTQTPFQLLGRSADGRWFAVADPANPDDLAGWIQAGVVELHGDLENLPQMAPFTRVETAATSNGTTAILTKVYALPGAGQVVVDIRMPQDEIQVQGRSADGEWLAVADPANPDVHLGWIPAGEVALQNELKSLLNLDKPAQVESATTVILAKVYDFPGTGQSVVDVLMPQQNIRVYGRSAEGQWLAISRAETQEGPLGWVPAGEVKFEGKFENLSIIPSQLVKG
jgi:hypothetical protein